MWGDRGAVVRTVLSVDDAALFRPADRGRRRLGLSGHAVIW
jgi:hypothetical protein